MSSQPDEKRRSDGYNSALRRREPRQPRQPRARDKVARLIAAARDCFNRAGYAHTTMARIAQAAGVSVGTAYAYFRDKDDVLATVLASHVDELLHPAETIIRSARPRRHLRATLRTLLAQTCATRDAYLGLHQVFHERMREDQRLRDLVNEFRARSRTIIRELCALHGYRRLPRADAFIETALGILEYCTEVGTLFPSPVPREEVGAVTAEMLDSFLRFHTRKSHPSRHCSS